MRTRRQFVKMVMQAFASVGLANVPMAIFPDRAKAKSQKVVLPKGRPTPSLIDKNPADLDTRNLDIMPLSQFQTMGVTDYTADIEKWRLVVDGKVKTPLRISYDDMKALPSIERNVLLLCPGVFVNHGKWKGVSVKKLLAMAGARKDLTHVTISGPDTTHKMTERFPISELQSDKIFLAYAVNGQPLPEKHGFPCRLVAEGAYGFRWVKYVCHLTAEYIPESSDS